MVCLELLNTVSLSQTADLIFPYRLPFPCGFATLSYDLPKFAFCNGLALVREGKCTGCPIQLPR